MTGLAAAVVGLRDRGILQPKYKADIVVFDPQEFTDTATYAEPHQYAAGVKFVWVNGHLVIENGKHTGRRSGMVLKK
jgi:N-acyl-D-amino-acid deacylase